MVSLKQYVPVALIAIGIVVILTATLVSSTNFFKDFSAGFYDGKKVDCTARVDAGLFSGHLQIDDVSCTVGRACRTQQLSIVGSILSGVVFDPTVEGSLLLKQSGKVYDTASVEQSRLGSGDNYGLSACIPQDAGAVMVSVTSSTGGVDDERVVNIA